ncbi:acyltransferase [Aliiglaciecola sp. LCG003]|uniref:acyltransferase family protein n=1 Tax=Aliiglaciecola sp. LCG003 TaxID=3053655 RepID=UPI002573AE6A|nr:acyltransferase [Aliiglaciecola sp. LCG003]WJG10458.1 acyltransferase [Aliiglaciecola sp. LCG003]
MISKIKGFNGIRALAALTVVFTHIGAYRFLEHHNYISRELIQSFDGSAGVQAFFILSGFLITYLLVKEYHRTGTVSLYNFYLRRTLRIFPLYFLVVFLIGILHFFGSGVTNGESILFSIFYIYNFIPKEWYSSVLGHTWSLAVEEHFYLIWPFVFITMAKYPSKLVKYLVMFIGISIISNIVLQSIEYVRQSFFIGRFSFIAGANIAYGCILALAISSSVRRKSVERILASSWLLILGLLLWQCALWLPKLQYLPSVYIRGVGLAICIAWIFLNQSSLLVRVLEFRPLNYLGEVSYGIYMYQGFYLATGPYRAAGQTWPISQEIGLVLLVITVPISFHLFERPITKLKRKWQKDC